MNTKDQTIEIDVLQLLHKIWDKKVLISFAGIFFAAVSFLYSTLVVVPKYDATTRIYVVNKTGEASVITAQDLQAGSFLVNDYKEIITSSDVLNKVVEKEGLNMTAGELGSKVSVDIPTNTRVISISVRDSEPKMASQLADSVREVAAEKIKEVTKVEDVTTLEAAKLPSSPSTPNTKRNVLLGLMAGFVLAIAAVVLFELLDDRIKRPEDVEEVLGLPLLGIVPNFEKM
ncbi:capsular biosynthesis protein CpsC [Streptococcus gallolyticus]|uniref:Wzz/FepE/Etk N-terminal domain-containing protein n=1 Tax=Streptococcus gallinaceus TaxID=165758 RepID=UPI001C95CEC8|nr:Wzz/FepE/Etk N-terminal domain-containing protein [Streptococcus gallinaceus]MBY5033796.1 capsular biosynthesis protein CpsC [Streptococcus gallolyticus]MBY5041999.1 capsular biosynthesis protein CpsC [Streptococcus gallolyticus]MCP1770150.1 MPA1 family polysaccharide export protein [Streptococcus gallinaceus]